MRLFLDIGHCDRSTKQATRLGACLAAVADGVNEAGQGVLLACAEAVAGRPDGERAARTSLTALSDTYYSTADAGTPEQTLQEGINAANSAVRATGERGRAAAVAALVLHGRRWYTAHAGHIRVWRYRDLQIKQLTRDHLVPRAPRQAEVVRACGYDETVDAEYGEGELQEGDILVLTTPGVHDVLTGSALLGVLQSDATAQQMADALVQQALTAHTPAYAAACVARVEKLPRETTTSRGSLPALDQLPSPGDIIDGFIIKKPILKSRRFRVYRALDRESNENVILRFPDPSREANAQAFLREESISRRIDSPHILKPVPLRPGRRTALYSVIEYRKAESVAKRIRRKQGLPVDEALRLGDQLLATIETLHRLGVIHGDVRPHNLLYDRDKKMLYVFGIMGNTPGNNGESASSGSLSYRAPELANGAPATERSDVYAAGVTIYRMLTGAYPYGKVQPNTDFSRLHFTPVTQYQEQALATLDDVLARACALDPANRYSKIAQFAAALSAVQISGSTNASAAIVPESTGNASMKWMWGAAAILAAVLLGYLYLALT